MFTEKTIGRDDAREASTSTLDADFAAHATAIEELYQQILTEIAETARAWTPEAALREAPSSARTETVPTPRSGSRSERRSEPRTEAITVPQPEAAETPHGDVALRTDAIATQQSEAPVRTRGAHHAETGQMAAISMRPAVPRNAAA